MSTGSLNAWWDVKPRHVSVVIDNPSWILPYGESLVNILAGDGDDAHLCRNHGDIKQGGVAFYLGCTRITPPEILARNHKNLVVHESALPKGRGFAPMSWQILEGQNEIPICLLEAVEAVDAGAVVLRDKIILEGHELHDEWRNMQGQKTIELCLRYMRALSVPEGTPQSGESSLYPRRRAKDSELNLSVALEDQFDLLRIVDNDSYPAFFTHRGHTYTLKIEKHA